VVSLNVTKDFFFCFVFSVFFTVVYLLPWLLLLILRIKPSTATLELKLWRQYIKHKKVFHQNIQTSRRGCKKTRHSRGFLTDFDVFWYLMEHSFEFLTRLLKPFIILVEIQSKSSHNFMLIKIRYPNHRHGSDFLCPLFMNNQWVWEKLFYILFVWLFTFAIRNFNFFLLIWALILLKVRGLIKLKLTAAELEDEKLVSDEMPFDTIPPINLRTVKRICLNIKTSHPWWSLFILSSLDCLNK